MLFYLQIQLHTAHEEKHMANNDNIIKREYNAKLLSDLLYAARGTKRTGVEFCKECGISTPTFSRYLNGHNKRPCPVEMLKKIAEHADPDSKVTYEQLIAANGGHEAYDYGSRAELTKNEFIGILTTALLFRRCEFQYPEDVKPVNVMGLTYCPDWSIRTNAIDGQVLKTWQFIFWKELGDFDTAAETDRIVRQLLLLVAISHLGYLSFDKLTFAITSTPLYTEILKRTKHLKLDFFASFLLVDPVSKVIRAEHNVVSNMGTAPLSIFSADAPFSPSENSLLSVGENNIL